MESDFPFPDNAGGGGSAVSAEASTSSSSTSSPKVDMSSAYGTVKKAVGTSVGELVPEDIIMSPVRSTRILIDTKGKFSPNLIYKECDFQELQRCRVIGELHARVDKVQTQLNTLGIFKHVTAFLDTNPDNPLDVDVVFKVDPLKTHYTFGANVNATGQTSCEFSFDVPSIWNGCTSAKCTAKTPTWRILEGYEMNASLFNTQFLGKRGLRSSLELLSSTNDMKQYCSYDEMVKGLNASLSYKNHSLIAEICSLRDIMPAQSTASLAIQTCRLRSVKTGLKYEWLNNSPFGLYSKLTLEGAGLMGDANYVKADGAIGKTWNLGLWTFSVFGAGGVLQTLDGQASCVQDRFFLGGSNGYPNSMFKGFGFRRMGPCAPRNGTGTSTAASPTTPESTPLSNAMKYDYIGGNLYANGYAMLGRQFKVKDSNARAFGFLQGGSLGLTADSMTQKLVAGIGISVPTILGGDFEVTASYPLMKADTDSSEMFQFGLRFMG